MKILKPILPILLCYTTCIQAQISIHISSGCNSEGTEIHESYPTLFLPSDEALHIVDFVVEIADVPRKFELRCSNLKNVMATVDNDKQYLLYSTSFLRKFDRRNSFWGAYFVLAHEIGHYFKKHDFNETDPYRIKYNELEADLFAGSVLRMLGATLEEAQYGVSSLNLLEKTDTRPAKSSRLDAMTVGWKRQDKKQKNEPLLIEKYPVKAAYLALPEQPKRIEKGTAFYTQKSLEPKAIEYSGDPSKMPNLPWPPPKCFLRKTLFKNLSAKAHDFSDIDDRLQRVLDAQGYYQRSYYETPGGFALVTQMEQFQDDGSIKARFRWSDYPVQEDFDGVWSYFKSLVMPEPGRFRVFVFVVTDQPYAQSEEIMPQLVAKDMVNHGFSQIPQKYSTTEVTPSHNLDVLIYEFEAPQSTKRCKQKCPAFLDVQTHLLMSGLSEITGF